MGSIVGLGVASSIIIDLLRSVFFIIDGLIYGVAGLFFKFALEFVNINDFINLSNVLSRVSQVIYSFLAIFMFFRVSFSLLQWLVDPDKMADKELGAKKIVINVMICLFLIVAVPKVFEVAMNVQDKVIKENLIGQAIYGDENVKVNDVGETLARATWGLFIRPADNLIDANIFINETEVWDNYFNVSQGANDDAEALLKLFGVLNSKTVIVAGEYKLVYLFFISTIVGLYLCWTFVKLAIDFAYRAIKMFMLQLLSPIAIISYIDPKSSKNGVFAKWLKETVKTYISLFVRIACYSIAALLMNEFVKSLYERETSTINKILIINGDTFISLIYILAIIAFVKNAPKFIDGILGTEISKGSEAKFGSDLLKQGLGFATGAAIGGITGGVVAKRTGQPIFKNVMKNAWQGGQKVSAATKKGGLGGLTGVISSGFGTVADVKKGLGYNVDKDQEKLVKKLKENVVPEAEPLGGKVSSSFDDGSKFNSILREGRKVNGRTYGMGLEEDDTLKNDIIKNASSLAKDEVKHSDDEDYLKLRRLVADKDKTNAIVSRAYKLAKDKYEHDENEYIGAKDKASYVISFANEVAKKEYGQMDAASIQAEFTRQLENYKNTARSSFQSSNRTSQIELIVGAGVDRTQAEQMNETQLSSAYEVVLDTISNNRMTAFNNGSASDKVNLTVDLNARNISHEVASASERDLGIMFSELNDRKVEATFGNSLGNMASDSAKAESDAKSAKEGLNKYLNSGKGKKAKDIDAAYETAKNEFEADKLKRQSS